MAKRNPYRSRAQQRLFHALVARGEISPKVVREYDRASKGKRLPQYVKTRRNPADDPAGEFIMRAYRDPFVRKTLTPALVRRLARELDNHTYNRREALDLWKQWTRVAAQGIPGTASPALVNEVAHRMMVHHEATEVMR